jgi:hypothetical protein
MRPRSALPPAQAARLVALLATFVGCGSTSSGFSGDAGFGDASLRGDGSDATASDGKTDHAVAPSCTSGVSCGDGGSCLNGMCCSTEHVCGAACCGAGDLCSFNKCVTPGATCLDSSGCKSDQYCQYSVATTTTPDAGARDASGCVGAVTPPMGVCLPAPPICPGDAGAPDGAACIESCEYHPPAAQFTPTLAYAWGGQITSPFATDVMMAPIVLPLEDTNCDGQINAEDIPDIVFSTFTGGAYTSNGTLHAISVRGGQLVDRWSIAAPVNPIAQLAGGNIDGVPGNEVVGCLGYSADGGEALGVRAFKADGSTLWTSTGTRCFMPALADLDGDGTVEVVTEGGILDGATGALKHSWTGVAGTVIGNFAISDLDGDGVLDIVTAVGAYHADGTRFVTAMPTDTNAEAGSNYVAVGDLDKDGRPEVIATSFASHTVSVWDYAPSQPGKLTWMRQGIDINSTLTPHCVSGSAGSMEGGGPPTVADFNGDGTPDVALAGGIGYAILDGSKVATASVANADVFLWTSSTTDCSSAETGSSVFDFRGDGKAEALYSDEEHLRVYDGPSGTVLWSACNTTGTVVEYPLVVDVDNDGHADIVVVSNAYASGGTEYQCQDTPTGPIAQSGVRVFSDANLTWVRTRAIWNQHTYHVTNVNDDGTLPTHELANWKQAGLNDFRQNKQPGSEFAAPDAVVSLAPTCGSPFALAVTVRNIGEAALPAGVVVGIYGGTAPTGTKLGATTTLVPLYSAQSETLVVPLPGAPAEVQSGKTPVYAIVDDTTTPHPSWHECNTTNNSSGPVSTGCNQPK